MNDNDNDNASEKRKAAKAADAAADCGQSGFHSAGPVMVYIGGQPVAEVESFNIAIKPVEAGYFKSGLDFATAEKQRLADLAAENHIELVLAAHAIDESLPADLQSPVQNRFGMPSSLAYDLAIAARDFDNEIFASDMGRLADDKWKSAMFRRYVVCWWTLNIAEDVFRAGIVTLRGVGGMTFTEAYAYQRKMLATCRLGGEGLKHRCWLELVK